MSWVDQKLGLLVGDLSLSRFEDTLSEVWPKCNDGDERAFRVISAFWRIVQNAATQNVADIVLMDLGPNLGAINRAALISGDYRDTGTTLRALELHSRKADIPFLRGTRRPRMAAALRREVYSCGIFYIDSDIANENKTLFDRL